MYVFYEPETEQDIKGVSWNNFWFDIWHFEALKNEKGDGKW